MLCLFFCVNHMILLFSAYWHLSALWKQTGPCRIYQLKTATLHTRCNATQTLPLCCCSVSSLSATFFPNPYPIILNPFPVSHYFSPITVLLVRQNNMLRITTFNYPLKTPSNDFCLCCPRLYCLLYNRAVSFSQASR
jgi:hypothetical protein